MQIWQTRNSFWWSILLLSLVFVDSFSLISPLKGSKIDTKHHEQNQQQQVLLQSSKTAPLQMTEDGADMNSSPPMARFLTMLFRGLTLPFPTLRNLTLLGNKNKKADHNDDDASSSSTGISLRESILAILVYLVLGAFSYHSTIADWSFVDALYFSVVTFTTVGYGDLCPTTGLGKAFTILFGLSGISILGAAIGTIGSNLVDKENEMIQVAKAASQKRILGFWNSTTSEPASVVPTDTMPPNIQEQEKQSWWKQTINSFVGKSVPAFVVLLVGGVWMGHLEGWKLGDAIYYSFVTAGTIGYGDFSPITRPGRLWGVLFIPLAVAAAGEVLGNVASALLDRRQQKFYHSVMNRELNAQSLVDMDTDQNGKVSREEYVEFMLREMQYVDGEVFRELHAQFEKLDVDGGGYLDQDDLKRKLAMKNDRNP